MSVHFDGLILGGSSVALIAISRWACIKGEYYFTKRIWIGFLIVGLIQVLASLFVYNLIISSILSVSGFCFLWGIGEVIEQEERVEKGWYPKRDRSKAKREE